MAGWKLYTFFNSLTITQSLNSSNCKFTSDYIFSNCRQDDSQDDGLEMGSAYVVVYSVTDCSSFDTASALHITLRHAQQVENIPIILVGNKSGLVQSRGVCCGK